MKVTMDLDHDAYHVKDTEPLKLKEVDFKVKPEVKERKRLFRKPLYELTIIAEANDQTYEFEGYDVDNGLISKLENEPSGFIVGDEPPFLCGTDWPDSGISEVVKENNVPLDSLFITDGKKVLAIIYNDEIPELVDWMKRLIN